MFLSVLLIFSAGLAVDVGRLWFHRQAAQAAADSACQAGALDLLVNAAGASSKSGFVPGQDGACSPGSASSICVYAADNGYNSAGPGSGPSNSSAWNTVSYSFPASVPGVQPPTISGNNSNYLQVTVTESVETFLIQLVKGAHFSQLRAQCTCGLAQVQEAAPVLVLDPKSSGSFYYSGGAGLNIIGGPQRSLQVNSSSSSAIDCVPSGLINTSAGGPKGTGSDVGITGDEPPFTNCWGAGNNATGFNGGPAGHWIPNDLPVGDPYAGVAPPASVKNITPATKGGAGSGTYYTWVGYHIDGCPVPGTSGPAYYKGLPTNCAEFAPGYYPTGIPFPDDYSTILFLPGVYYLNGTGSFAPGGSNTIRVGMPCWSFYPGAASGTGGYSAAACGPAAKANHWVYTQGSGVVFYFLNGSFEVSGGQGSSMDPVLPQELTCDGSMPPAALHMTSLQNNVLWAPCTNNGTYYDTGGDTDDGPGNLRGLLFFEDHTDSVSPSFSGSGQLSFAGSFYFHNNSYTDTLSISGGANTGNFILGNIVADRVSLTGSGAINLALPAAPSAPELKVAVFQ